VWSWGSTQASGSPPEVDGGPDLAIGGLTGLGIGGLKGALLE